jgi:hypothetical protein
MTADTIRNLEGLLKSKEELMKMKETGMEKLTMAIEERKKVHEQLAVILKSIQYSEEEIKKLQDENNIQMIQMVSLLEKNGSTAGGAQDVPAKKELFFSQLMSIVEDSTTEDNVDTLKRKMEKSIELYDEKQCESMAISSDYQFRKKVKIAIHLFDENDWRIPTVPWLENGFRFQPLSPSLTAGSEIHQDSLLVSHAVFSLLKHQKIELKREEPASPNRLTLEPAAASAIMEEPQTVVLSQKKRKKSAKKEKSQQPIQSLVQSLPFTVRPMNKFVLDNLSIFKFRLFHLGKLEGEIVIRPELSNFKNCDFLQKLGQFCFKTQQVFCSKKIKVTET